MLSYNTAYRIRTAYGIKRRFLQEVKRSIICARRLFPIYRRSTSNRPLINKDFAREGGSRGEGDLGGVRVVARERVFFFYPEWGTRAAPIFHALISGPILCFVCQRKAVSYSGLKIMLLCMRPLLVRKVMSHGDVLLRKGIGYAPIESASVNLIFWNLFLRPHVGAPETRFLKSYTVSLLQPATDLKGKRTWGKSDHSADKHPFESCSRTMKIEETKK